MLKVYKEHGITKIMDIDNNITLELSYNENTGLVVIFEDYPIWLYDKYKKELFITKADKKIYQLFNNFLNSQTLMRFTSDYNRSKEKNELYINKTDEDIVMSIHYNSDLPNDQSVFIKDGFTNNSCTECDSLFCLVKSLTPDISKEEVAKYKATYQNQKELKIKKLIKK